ncbi:amidohydrolase family protein [Agrobacterium sp. Ap1]|uniref:amidohydrolase family protein n=1 Tax=Agrobacterium sp. Ap1 TaxID=2815337 RepID=UPI00336C17C6
MHDHENFERPAIIIPPEQMHRLVDREIRKLVQRRMPFREHISYNENITPFLDALEALNREIPFNGLRWSLEHAETITPENIERVKKLGGGIALDHKMALHGDVFIKSRGLDQALRTTRLLQLVDSVIPLAMSTDAFRAATFNPWVGLSWMVTGRSVSGSEVLAPENRLTSDEALKLFTKGGAWFMNTESEMGLIAPGNLADFAILDRDDFSVPDDQIKSVSSVLTVMDGRVVFGAQDYAALSPILPAWSPVKYFGTYYGEK